ncbi:hypothetical protein [Streptomyces virginiae]|uniref:hypothetical protein n=1 Tax=Streptomyces virginiae TaxID=1961 RepID=UPI00364765E7
MSDPRPRVTATKPPAATAVEGIPAPGVIGIGLAAVLTFALAQGSWRWFATFIGVAMLVGVYAWFRDRARARSVPVG